MDFFPRERFPPLQITPMPLVKTDGYFPSRSPRGGVLDRSSDEAAQETARRRFLEDEVRRELALERNVANRMRGTDVIPSPLKMPTRVDLPAPVYPLVIDAEMNRMDRRLELGQTMESGQSLELHRGPDAPGHPAPRYPSVSDDEISWVGRRSELVQRLQSGQSPGLGRVPEFGRSLELGRGPELGRSLQLGQGSEFGRGSELSWSLELGPGPEFCRSMELVRRPEFGGRPELDRNLELCSGPGFDWRPEVGRSMESGTALEFGWRPGFSSNSRLGSGPEFARSFKFGPGPEFGSGADGGRGAGWRAEAPSLLPTNESMMMGNPQFVLHPHINAISSSTPRGKQKRARTPTRTEIVPQSSAPLDVGAKRRARTPTRTEIVPQLSVPVDAGAKRREKTPPRTKIVPQFSVLVDAGTKRREVTPPRTEIVPQLSVLIDAGAKRREETLPRTKIAVEPPATRWACALCKVVTSSQLDLDCHLKGKKHIAAVEEMNDKKASQNDNTTNCSIKEHEKATEELPVNGPKVEPAAELEKKTPRQSPVKCKVCNIVCTGPTSYSYHLIGKKHMRVLELLKSRASSKDKNTANSTRRGARQ